jgi:hypothetical protein
LTIPLGPLGPSAAWIARGFAFRSSTIADRASLFHFQFDSDIIVVNPVRRYDDGPEVRRRGITGNSKVIIA